MTWDKASPGKPEHEAIHFSFSSGDCSVMVTEEPRILRNELIAIGCTVRRG